MIAVIHHTDGDGLMCAAILKRSLDAEKFFEKARDLK